MAVRCATRRGAHELCERRARERAAHRDVNDAHVAGSRARHEDDEALRARDAVAARGDRLDCNRDSARRAISATQSIAQRGNAPRIVVTARRASPLAATFDARVAPRARSPRAARPRWRQPVSPSGVPVPEVSDASRRSSHWMSIAPRLKLGVVHHAQMKVARCLHADDRELEQRATHARDRFVARVGPHDELAEQRIVVQPDLAPCADAAVPTRARDRPALAETRSCRSTEGNRSPRPRS